MIECNWLYESRCRLAELIVGGIGLQIISPQNACETCQQRHPATPSVESPGTVVASLVGKADPSKNESMKAHRRTVKAAKPLVQLSQKNGVAAVAEGVGTEVSTILKSIGINAEDCGQCRDMIDRMNGWGVAGCEQPEHRETILKRLREQAAHASWWTTAKAATLSVTTGLACEVDWSDPAPGILDKAIRSVREREAAPPPN